MKKTTTLFLILIIAISGSAQFSGGIKTGLAFSNININGGLASIEKISHPITSASLGVFGQYNISRDFGIRLGANYVQRGIAVQEAGYINMLQLPVAIGAEIQFKAKYFEIPIALTYSIDHGPFESYALAGIGLSTALDAKLQPRVTALLDFNLPEVNVNTGDFNSTDVFGHGGLGLAYHLSKGKIFIEGQYQHSFESLKPNFLVDLDLKNKGFSVGIGYAMSF